MPSTQSARRGLFTFGFCFLVLATNVVAHEAPTFDEDAIEAEIHRSFASLVKVSRALDVDGYLSHFDRERFTALNANGTVVHSFAEFEQVIRRGFAALEVYESLDFDRVKVVVLDADTAILVNEYRAVVRMASGSSLRAAGGGTQVWQRTDAGWKLVSVSSSNLPAAEEADSEPSDGDD